MVSCSNQPSTATSPLGSQSNPYILTKGITFRLTNKVRRDPEDGGGAFDLTGFTGESQMRVRAEDVGAPIATFDVAIQTPETSGIAKITLDASLSENITPGLYVFDIRYIDGIDPENVVSGTGQEIKFVRVVPSVTKT